MARSRSTIADGYLDGLIPLKEETNETSVAVLEEEKQIPQIRKMSSKKQRITVQISEEVIERIKNAVYWTPGLTLASLAEESFTKVVDSLEKEREAPFPKRKEELKTGRPIS